MAKFEVVVSWKPDVLDAEGRAIAESLRARNIPVDAIATSRRFVVDCPSRDIAEKIAKIDLAHPVSQDFSVRALE